MAIRGTPGLRSVRRIRRFVLLTLALAMLSLIMLSSAPAATAAPAPQGPQPINRTRVYLPVLMRVGPPPTSQPTSDDLIDAAIAKGEISAETGLVYKVFAVFGDPRLPAKYKGDDSKSHESPWLSRAAAQWPQLSRETRTILAPFIQPPLYKQSWLGQRQAQAAGQVAPEEVPTPLPDGNWQSLTVLGGKVRVWWNPQASPNSTQAMAQRYGNIIAERTYPMLTAYMKRTPLDDTGPHVFTDLNGEEQVWGDGEDGALDIYIVEIMGSGGALTVAYPPGCQARPAFMLLEPNHPNIEAAISHEFMHVLQFTYKPQGDCQDYNWLQEGTANWALDYVYSSNNYEHWARFLAYRPHTALDEHDYASWVVFWQLDRTLGLPDSVRLIWEKTEQTPGSLAAVNAALPGGLATQWHKVALHNLNRLTLNELSRLDQFTEPANLTQDMDLPLNAAPHKTYQLAVNLRPPAAQYYHFTTDDETIASLSFINPYTTDKFPTVHVQALVHIQGRPTWESVADWTGRSISFCREVKAERIDELYLIISDHRWSAPRPALETPAPTIELSNIACRAWKGEVQYKSWYIDEIEPGVALSEINQDFWTGVTFWHAPLPNGLQGAGHALFFAAEPSTVVSVNEWGWWLNGEDPPRKCQYLVDDAAPIAPERSYMLIYGDKSRAYTGWGDMPVFDLKGQDACEGQITAHYDSPDWWLTGDGPDMVVSQDGRRISGKLEKYRTPTSWATYEWTFTALMPE